MAKLGLVLNKDFSIKRIDETYLDDVNYDYIAEIKEMYFNNGNGTNRLTLLNAFEEQEDIEINGWRLRPQVQINFSWSGRNAELEITDPFGVVRNNIVPSNQSSLFKDSPYTIDLSSILTAFHEVSKSIDWVHIDLISERNRLHAELKSLKEQLLSVEDQLSHYDSLK